MMDSKKGTVEYSVEIKDGVSDKAEKMAGSLDKANAKMTETDAKTKGTRTELELLATVDAVKAMSALHSVQSGFSAINSSMNTLQIGSEELRQGFASLTAGVQLFVGVAQTVKGVSAIMSTLNATMARTAVMSVFASVAANPLLAGVTIAAAGAAAGYAASYITNNKTVNITTSTAEETRQTETTFKTGAWW